MDRSPGGRPPGPRSSHRHAGAGHERSRRRGAAGTGKAVAAAVLARALPRPVTDAYWGRDRLTVLAYHRLGDVDEVARDFEPRLVSTSPAAFARQMRWVRRNFSVIGLERLREHVRDARPLPERPLLITFDDGYRDNHAYALPVLRDLGLPAVIFLITGAIGTDRVMWWDELAHMLAHTPRLRADLPLAGVRDLTGADVRAGVRDELARRLKELPDEGRVEALGLLRDALAAPAPAPDEPLFMDWGQVEELVENGVECQPHTEDHPLLIRVDAERARREVERSAAAIVERTGRPAVAFAYPNGDYDAAAMSALRDAGIDLAFTMRLGPAPLADVERAPLEIQRVPIDATDTWDLFRLKVGGGLSIVFRGRAAIRGGGGT